VTPARGRWHYSAMSPVPLLSASPQLSLVECEDHDYPHLLAAATHRAAHKGQIQTVVSVGWTALIFHSPISPCFHILCIFPLSILNMKERIMREAREVMYHSFKSHQAEVQKTQSFFFPYWKGISSTQDTKLILEVLWLQSYFFLTSDGEKMWFFTSK